LTRKKEDDEDWGDEEDAEAGERSSSGSGSRRTLKLVRERRGH
jgi:hypothetical protein